MAVFLALLWLPMASHCDLEHLPGMEFLACCGPENTAPQHKDCETDVCASIESGNYKMEEQAVVAPVPPLLAPILISPAPAELENQSVAVASTSTVPTDLLQRWHFTLRVALSPRAPSLPS